LRENLAHLSGNFGLRKIGYVLCGIGFGDAVIVDNVSAGNRIHVEDVLRRRRAKMVRSKFWLV
jgi:hypothetical protein|tara:strand:+ start:462 stop:650 length:189 start_codon:yes stop_codon:yes gene_type:complete